MADNRVGTWCELKKEEFLQSLGREFPFAVQVFCCSSCVAATQFAVWVHGSALPEFFLWSCCDCYKKRPTWTRSGVCWTKSVILKLTLFLPVCFPLLLSCLFCRHITNATLAILKGETIPLDVLQIKVKASAHLAPSVPKIFLFCVLFRWTAFSL